MDALYGVTATESEPLVDDSSNGLYDSSSRTAQSNIIHSVAMQCHLLIKSIVRLKIPRPTDLTLINQNSTTNEEENSSSDAVEDLLPNDVNCLSTNETEDSNFNEFKVSEDTPARQQLMRVLNCYEESTRICEGISNEMFIPLVEKNKGIFQNVSGQPKYKCHL